MTTTKNRIASLPEEVARVITNAQVITSLAGAVRELIDNALDAGATVIDIRLVDNGTTSFEVVDNGSGIKADDFPNLAKAHCTSKLTNMDDFNALDTFGFRGEALHALALLSDLVIITRAESSPVASKLVFDHAGEITEKATCARGRGTTVTVNKLFSTMAVRRSELQRNYKKDLVLLIKTVQAFALAHPKIKFVFTNTLKMKKTPIFSTMGGTSKLKDVMAMLFGGRGKGKSDFVEIQDVLPEGIVRKMYELEKEPDIKFEVMKFHGYVTSTDSTASTDERQFLFVNNRHVDYPKAVKVIQDLYKQAHKHKNAGFVIFVDVHPSRVNVNITPDKRTVQLRDENIFLAKLHASLLTAFNGTKAMSTQIGLGSDAAPKEEVASQKLPNVWHSEKPTSSAASSKPSSSRASASDRPTKRGMAANSPPLGKRLKQTELPSSSRQRSPSYYTPVDTPSMSSSQSSAKSSSRAPPSRTSFPGLWSMPDNTTSANIQTPEMRKQLREARRNSPQKHQSTKPPAPVPEFTFEPVVVRRSNKETPPPREFSFSSYVDVDAEIESAIVVPPSKDSEPMDTDVRIEAEIRCPAPDARTLVEASNEPNPEVRYELVSKKDSAVAVYNFNKATKVVTAIKSKEHRTGAVIDHAGYITYLKTLADNGHFELPASAGEDDDDQKVIAEEKATEFLLQKESFNDMHILFQYNKSFIFTSLDKHVFAVDQHAADEKFNYENILNFTEIKRQKLIHPIELLLSPVQFQILVTNLDYFENCGFTFEIKEDHAKLSSVPNFYEHSFGADDVDEILAHLEQFPGQYYRSQRMLKAAASKACRRSIMVGDDLEKRQIRKLITNLSTLKNPWNCPHGRPTIRLLHINLPKRPSFEVSSATILLNQMNQFKRQQEQKAQMEQRETSLSQQEIDEAQQEADFDVL
uniref:DNA_mis_repair domain-containing protein n=1 Tax=Panagrellus redivivus TaxID=6233 RepID=A0A7E4VU38_PANRE